MGFSDLSAFISKLKQENELLIIDEEVNPELEVTEIVDKCIKRGGPSLLFTNVKGSSIPLAINLFGSNKRMGIALGVENIQDIGDKLERLIDIKQFDSPPSGLIDKLRIATQLKRLSDLMPKTISSGSCQEVELKGEECSLSKFPIIKCWPEDGGKYITFPLVFTKDPENSKQNCGIYRMQVYGERETGMHWHPHKDGARHFDKYKKLKKRMPVSVVIGASPEIAFSGGLPLPPDINEMIVAGLIKGEGIKMVKSRTNDILVPADSEIVLEGYVDPEELKMEGPFGDHTGYYSLADKFPVFHIEHITHRKTPIYHSIIVGKPPMEDCFMGYAIERIFAPAIKKVIPEVVDYHMPFEGVFHNLLIVAIKKTYAGQAKKVMNGIWGMGQMMFTKVIVIVDEDTDVHNLSEVTWKVLNNIDPKRDMLFTEGPLDILDHSSNECGFGSKVGIDGTKKLASEGFKRRWPSEIKMSEDIVEKVSKICNRIFSG